MPRAEVYPFTAPTIFTVMAVTIGVEMIPEVRMVPITAAIAMVQEEATAPIRVTTGGIIIRRGASQIAQVLIRDQLLAHQVTAEITIRAIMDVEVIRGNKPKALLRSQRNHSLKVVHQTIIAGGGIRSSRKRPPTELPNRKVITQAGDALIGGVCTAALRVMPRPVQAEVMLRTREVVFNNG